MEDNKPSGALTWIVLVLIIIGGIFFFTRSAKAPEATGPLKVGVLLPMTGDAATYGEAARNIYQIAADEINKAGGVKGRPLELIVEDSKCNGKDAANAAQKLVNVDYVQIIIGGFCSGESMAAVPIAAAAKVALFSAGSSNPGLTGISPFFFRNYPSDSSQGAIIAEVSYTDKNWKKVAVIQEQTDYAGGVFKAFSEKFVSLGGMIAKEEFPSATTDFRSILSKLKTANADALFIDTQTPPMTARILDQLGQLKWKPALIINDATAGDTKTVAQYAGLLEGALTAQFGVDEQNPKFQHILEAYKTKYGGNELPFQSYGQTEYDAVYMVRDAIAAVGYDGQKIADWSRTVKNWEGASGKITILPSGDREGGHRPQVVKAGKVENYSR